MHLRWKDKNLRCAEDYEYIPFVNDFFESFIGP